MNGSRLREFYRFQKFKVCYFFLMFYVYVNDILRQIEFKGYQGDSNLDFRRIIMFNLFVFFIDVSELNGKIFIKQFEMKSWIFGKFSIEIRGFIVKR